ncbi:MAG: ferritin-like domain-containing protein [Terriglobales bacterium]
MDGAAFVAQLKRENERLLGKLDAEPAAGSDAAALGTLLKIALKNEMEAAEIAAAWVATTPELEAKLALAQHAGDEARHFQLLAEKARALGVDLTGYDPLTPPSPVLEFLRSLETTVERVAAALVTREAMGGRRNAQFLKLLESTGQKELAALYRDVINPDEERHHQAGCALLAGLAATPEAQERARRAAAKLLEIGDRARDALLAKTGAACIPGC